MFRPELQKACDKEDICLATLSNGLRLVSHSNKDEDKSETVHLKIRVNAGHDQDNLPGIAHFVEHLQFRHLNPDLPESALLERLEHFVGGFTVQTAEDHVEFGIKCVPEDVPDAMRCLAEMLHFKGYRDEHVEEQRRIILSEMELQSSNLKQEVGNTARSRIFTDPLRAAPVWGDVETIQTLTKEELEAFAHSHYVAGNMVASISGAISPADAQMLAEQHWQDLPARAMGRTQS